LFKSGEIAYVSELPLSIYDPNFNENLDDLYFHSIKEFYIPENKIQKVFYNPEINYKDKNINKYTNQEADLIILLMRKIGFNNFTYLNILGWRDGASRFFWEIFVKSHRFICDLKNIKFLCRWKFQDRNIDEALYRYIKIRINLDSDSNSEFCSYLDFQGYKSALHMIRHMDLENLDFEEDNVDLSCISKKIHVPEHLLPSPDVIVPAEFDPYSKKFKNMVSILDTKIEKLQENLKIESKLKFKEKNKAIKILNERNNFHEYQNYDSKVLWMKNIEFYKFLDKSDFLTEVNHLEEYTSHRDNELNIHKVLVDCYTERTFTQSFLDNHYEKEEGLDEHFIDNKIFKKTKNGDPDLFKVKLVFYTPKEEYLRNLEIDIKNYMENLRNEIEENIKSKIELLKKAEPSIIKKGKTKKECVEDLKKYRNGYILKDTIIKPKFKELLSQEVNKNFGLLDCVCIKRNIENVQKKMQEMHKKREYISKLKSKKRPQGYHTVKGLGIMLPFSSLNPEEIWSKKVPRWVDIYYTKNSEFSKT